MSRITFQPGLHINPFPMMPFNAFGIVKLNTDVQPPELQFEPGIYFSPSLFPINPFGVFKLED